MEAKEQMRRTVIHVDMDAFFASVEQRCNPALRGRPIAVIGSDKRTVVTTSSYEARAYGVRTGMSKYEAKRLCPALVLVVGNNRKYTDVSARLIRILSSFSPRVEPYSIDEAFIDATGVGCFGTPEDMGALIRQRVSSGLGLGCSVGIGANKLISKLASSMDKPGGLIRIRDEEDVEKILERVPVARLWGIGARLEAHLRAIGIRTAAELGRYPASLLRSRFGITGEHLSLMGRGIDASPVVAIGEEADAKSIGHSMTLKRDISDSRVIRREVLRLSEMVCRRARRYGIMGTRLTLTMRLSDFYTFSRRKRLPEATNDSTVVYACACSLVDTLSLRKAVRLIGVSISGLTMDKQEKLFYEDAKRERVSEAMDLVNDRFGESTLSFATLADDDHGPGVIPPSWRPDGVRRVEVE